MYINIVAPFYDLPFKHGFGNVIYKSTFVSPFYAPFDDQ